MKKLFVTLATAVLLFGAVASASAGEKRMSPEEAYVAGKMIDAFATIFGTAIASKRSGVIIYNVPRRSGPTGRYPVRPDRNGNLPFHPDYCWYPYQGEYTGLKYNYDRNGSIYVCDY